MNHASFQRLENQGKVFSFCVNDTPFQCIGPVTMPVNLGGSEQSATAYAFRKAGKRHDDTQATTLLLCHNYDRNEKAPLIRIHSGCLTGDVLGSQRCDCGSQLKAAWETIQANGSGSILYIPGHEGRGIGLFNKLAAYALQEDGLDTYEANRALGFDDDQRDYFEAAAIIQGMFPHSDGITLLSNNPDKINGLMQHGLKIRDAAPVKGTDSAHNAHYLRAKKTRGHKLQ